MIKFHQKPYKEEDILNKLHPEVLKWFRSKFKTFSPPQRYAILDIINDKNSLIASPTGSGKTLSFALAVITELLNLHDQGKLEDKIYCVYISPLKALGNDIQRNLNEPLEDIKKIAKRRGKEIDIKVKTRTGDTSRYEKRKMLKDPPHILITTPESFAISLSSKKFSKKFHDIRWVIVDEIHALASSKRGAHLSLSLERCEEITDFVRVGLSATISPLEKVAKFLVGKKYGKELEDMATDGEDSYRDCLVADARFSKDLNLKVLSPVDDFIDCSADKLQDNLYELIHSLICDHRTTLIFTNTRAGTERVVHHLKERYPKFYKKNIGAHHGSLSKDHRLKIEKRLKNGQLKIVVCSTSLELGIDIGYIDLVILLGSPKSVARALQRVGRSGHKLHDTIKGRIIVTDRDDLIECSVLLKSAVEGKIDKIHIPQNCLDVLAQQIFGRLMDGRTHREDLWEMVSRSYNFRNLRSEDFRKVLGYLAGEYTSLEDRYVYAKIFHDKENRTVGRRGKMARVIYMTNVGTIPEESYVDVKMGKKRIGKIEESFLEMLSKGDIFVLGGESYRFRYSRGMTAQVAKAYGRTPTVPSWYSEMLPLSLGLALDIQKFRLKMAELFEASSSEDKIKEFIKDYLYVDKRSANSLFRYFFEQDKCSQIPHRKKILIEFYQEGKKSWVLFHTLFGRRVNDCLSRVIAWLIARREAKDVEVGITDHGFYLMYEGKIKVMEAFGLLANRELRETLRSSLYDTEILKRRFRHCAARALMILRNYKGRRKSVGKQQVKSMILQSTVRDIDSKFPVLEEAYRETMEDAMDIGGAEKVLKEIKEGKIKIEARLTSGVSPFAFHILMRGHSDLIKAEDRQKFLKRLYKEMVADPSS